MHSRDSPLLPCRLTLASSANSAHALIVTVSKSVPPVHVENLPPQVFTSRKSVYLSPQSRALIGTATTFLASIQTSDSIALRYGLLVKNGFLDGSYELLEGCVEPLNIDTFLENGYTDIGDASAVPASVDEHIASWKTSENGHVSENRSAFSMKPPSAPRLVSDVSASAKHYTLSPQNEKNPLDFLRSRYYNTLYSLTTPLSYFPKTALSRFKNMCSNDNTQMVECLSQVHLSQAQLASRRSAKYGLRKGPQSSETSFAKSRFEAENQELFVAKHYQETNKEDLFENLVLELKIREAQLQIVLLLEILLCMGIDEESFLAENAKRQENSANPEKKPSLIRRKKKKVIPTFLGVAVPDNTPSNTVTKTEDHVSPFGLFSSLTTLIDQIGLWDSLLDHRRIDKDQNTHGFLAFVVVPYFSKTLPKLVSFIIKQVKSLRPNISKPKLSKAEKKVAQTLFPTPGSDTNIDENTDPPVSEWTKSLSSLDATEKPERKSRFAKALLSDKTPFLHRSATSIDTEAQPAFSLKRSKSNLGAKNLKRRQVDMSLVKAEAETESKRQSSFVVAGARKVKTDANLEHLNNPAMLQVEATPMKPKANPGTNSAFYGYPHSNMALSGPQSNMPNFATPSRQRTGDLVIKETPQNTQKKPSMHERMAQAAGVNPFGIDSSPVRESDVNLFSHGRFGTIDSSSPIKEVISSPVAVKSKPGQQISLRQSPFYNRQTTGSPPLKTSEAMFSPLAVRRSKVFETVKHPVETTAETTTTKGTTPKKGTENSIKGTAKSAAKRTGKSTDKETDKGIDKTAAKNANKSTAKSTAKNTVKSTAKTTPKTTAKPSRGAVKKRVVEDHPIIKGLSDADIFKIPDTEVAKPNPVSVTAESSKMSGAEVSHTQSIDRGGSETSRTKSPSFSSDTDSDSDYERLLASAQRTVPKKYKRTSSTM